MGVHDTQYLATVSISVQWDLVQKDCRELRCFVLTCPCCSCVILLLLGCCCCCCYLFVWGFGLFVVWNGVVDLCVCVFFFFVFFLLRGFRGGFFFFFFFCFFLFFFFLFFSFLLFVINLCYNTFEKGQQL